MTNEPSQSEMPTARNHHYVPQCYLRGFAANPKKPRLLACDSLDRRTFPTNPENVAVERDFHRIDLENVRPDALETVFSSFETDLSQALQRIGQSRSISDQEDRALLFNLIGLISVKNPRLRQSMAMARQLETRSFLHLITASKERWESQLRGARAAGYISHDADVSYEKVRDLVQQERYEVEIPPGAHLAIELEVFDKMLPYVFHRRWTLLKAPLNKTGFLTSDQPVCLQWADPTMRKSNLPPGLGLKNTSLVFPVSNELALVGAFEGNEDERDATQEEVAEINGIVMEHSKRQIYARDADFAFRVSASSKIMRGTDLVEQFRSNNTKPI